MKIEISRFSALVFVIGVPINLLTLALNGADLAEGMAIFSLSMFYLIIAAPIVFRWWAEEQAILRIGNMVEWTDTAGVVRKGKLLGQYNGNWVIDWVEPNYSVGALPPNELRKVRK